MDEQRPTETKTQENDAATWRSWYLAQVGRTDELLTEIAALEAEIARLREAVNWRNWRIAALEATGDDTERDDNGRPIDVAPEWPIVNYRVERDGLTWWGDGYVLMRDDLAPHPAAYDLTALTPTEPAKLTALLDGCADHRAVVGRDYHAGEDVVLLYADADHWAVVQRHYFDLLANGPGLTWWVGYRWLYGDKSHATPVLARVGPDPVGIIMPKVCEPGGRYPYWAAQIDRAVTALSPTPPEENPHG